jgi:zinc protease
MADLSAASFEDVVQFFKTYYAPNNASLSIAGDIDVEKTKDLVTKWFSEIPRGGAVPLIDAPPAYLSQEKRLAFEDRVQLPRLYMAWLSPAQFAPGDAALDILSSILTSGKNSRLYKRLVYELQIAQDVRSSQDSQRQISSFEIVATARAGHTLTEIEKVIQEEIDRLKKESPTKREVERAVNEYEASFINRLERIGSFGGKADQLNAYFVETGNPDYFNEDLARYRAIDPNDIAAYTQTFLRDDGRVVLSVVPKGKKELAAPGTFISVEGK